MDLQRGQIQSSRPDRGLVLVMGGMAAGKTTFGLMLMDRHRRAWQKRLGGKPLIVRHEKDTRFGDNMTRTGLAPHDAEVVVCGALGEVDASRITPGRFVMVDEGHFFEDLILADAWGDTAYVVVCALSGDYRREPFANVARLTARADWIETLFAVCECGIDAAFTSRVAGGTDTIEVGDSEYAPACRRCHIVYEG
jgi:thymidine kinase